eukprot:gnl/MRDRNA2_/MRDRNA2_153863_c0_seq1.p1 gnl/MRDRNA2_/MRDRNA2_153863_c0~~gnl/MRDRNA2_/MRDRNA2_153863_c0_seq1.p1  ORF type:complete len:102 (-),score=5.81 gnl/MRDRNA2_/MRDRNA2_153863_c0_seq1:457-762(-)
MAGIFKLKEILEKDSNNIDAHFYLGVFSLQSGQYEKVISRMDKVLSLDETVTDAYLYLGHAYSNLGDKEKAILNFEEFMAKTDNVTLKAEAKKHINELKNI